MVTERHGGDLRILGLTVGLYALIFALKLAVYLMTGVMALLAESFHTLTDIFVSGFLLAAAIWSRREADSEHAFGYGRAQNVAALVAATLFISFTSLRLYEEAIPRLFAPQEASHQNLELALGVLLVSMVIVAAPLVGFLRAKERGAAAGAQLMELVNDELGLLAALLGTVFIVLGVPIADPIATIAVATLIAYNAVGLFRENASFLLGRSPGPEFEAKVARLARSVPGVLGIHDLRAEYVGPNTVHTGMHVEVSEGLPIEQAARIADEVKAQVQQEVGCQYCVIHVEAGARPTPSA